MQPSCIYCSAAATHTLWRNQGARRWEARVADFPAARLTYCQRCAEAIAAGETGAQLARRLNREYTAKLTSTETQAPFPDVPDCDRMLSDV